MSALIRLGPTALLLASGCGQVGFDRRVGETIDARRPGDGGGAEADADGGVRANLAFVTAAGYPGALGGVVGADQRCRAEASAADLVGDFVAMLTAPDRPAPAALLEGSRGWQLLDGTWVADLPSQVADGSFLQPVDVAADRSRLGGVRVWTGALHGHCAGWTSTSDMGDQHYIPQWRRLSDGDSPCTGAYRLFCFERGHQRVYVPPPITGPRVFRTDATWTPGPGGLASADALCASEAATAGLGPSLALLSTSTTAAIDRVTGLATREVQRVDGVVVGRLATPRAYIMTNALGVGDYLPVWTGGRPDQPSTMSCGDWMSVVGSGLHGTSGDVEGFDQGLEACATPNHLFCVEQ